jgi:protein phosphatase
MVVQELLIKTDIGKNRENNEDAIYPNSKDVVSNIYAISDGMGGMEAGEVASAICIDECDHYPNHKDLKKLINSANQKILEYKETHSTKLGATFDIIHLGGEYFEWAHVGDSRIYKYSQAKKSLKLITSDHNIPGDLYKIGKLSSLEEARKHHMANTLLNNMGLKNIEIDSGKEYVDVGDIIILATDGFSDSMPYEKTEELIVSNYDSDNLAQILWDYALSDEAENSDNISMIVLKVVEIKKSLFKRIIS